MVQAVLYDMDGMLVHRRERFSDRYAQEHNIPPGVLNRFFGGEFQKCLTGDADLKEVIEPYLPQWKWQGTVDELLAYWFIGEDDVDERMVDHVRELRNKGVRCYLGTNNEYYRTRYLFDKVGLAKHFDSTFSSADIRHKKPEQEFWQTVMDHAGVLRKQDLLVWDDDDVNVQAARDFGCTAYLFSSFEEYKEQMDTLM